MPWRSTKLSGKNMADHPLQLRPDHRHELLRLIAAHFPREEVWAYGSRANGTAHDTSDLDLVVRHPGELQLRQGSALGELKAALSDSNLPFLVDLVDWAALPPSFCANILAQHIPFYPPDSSVAFTAAVQANQETQEAGTGSRR